MVIAHISYDKAARGTAYFAKSPSAHNSSDKKVPVARCLGDVEDWAEAKDDGGMVANIIAREHPARMSASAETIRERAKITHLSDK